MSELIDRAAEIIHQGTQALGVSVSRARDRALLAARALADAGLLAPAAPEPDREMISPNGVVWYPSGPLGDIRATPGKIISFGMWQERGFRIITTPNETRTIAATWLAAADFVEREQK